MFVKAARRGARRPTAGRRQTHPGGDLFKAPLPSISRHIVKQMTSTDASDKQIYVAVIVKVTSTSSQAIELKGLQPCGLRDVREPAISGVAVQFEAGLRGAVRPVLPRPGAAVDQQDILPAVVVVIQHAHARPHCFGQKFQAIGAIEVLELDVGFRGGIPEGHGGHGNGRPLPHRFDDRGRLIGSAVRPPAPDSYSSHGRDNSSGQQDNCVFISHGDLL